MARYIALLILAVMAVSPRAVAETTVVTTFGLRLINEGTVPDPDLLEGGIPVTFTGDGAITVAGDDTRFEQVNAWTITTVLAWDETSLEVDFVDAADDTTHVHAIYEPPMPLVVSEHTLPVINVITDPVNLWDPDTGIYVLGNYDNCLQQGDEWERSASVEIHHDDILLHDELIGLRMHGQTSRTWDQKSLRVYFDDYGLPLPVQLDLFDGETVSLQRLVLRTGRHPYSLLNSQFAETLFHDLGHTTSRYAPVDVYLNGESWGLYCLRERYDHEYVETTLGIDEPYILLKDGESVVGDASRWYDLLDSFATVTDPTDHAWYSALEDSLDLATFVDWQFINIFGASSDNGFDRNRVLLRVADGSWQHMCWDEDGVLVLDNLNANHFDWYTAQNAADFDAARPPFSAPIGWSESIYRWTRMFHILMQNSEFKARFASRVEELLAGPMAVAAMQQRLDILQAGQVPGMPFQSARWEGDTLPLFNWFYDTARSWVDERHGIVTAQLAEFLERYRLPVEVSSFLAQRTGGGVDLAWRTESEDDNEGFLVYRSVGEGGEFELLASYLTESALLGAGTTTEPTTYQYSDTTAPTDQLLRYQLAHVDGRGTETLVNWIETVQPAGIEDLRLNELQADNEGTIADDNAEYDDWFELVNPGPLSVSLAGLFVTDDPGLDELHALDSSLAITAGGYLILWADGQPAQGPAHLPFRLSSAGEYLALVAADSVTVLDEISFGRQFPDRVFQRYPDGTGAWTWGRDPSPGTANTAPMLAGFLVLNELMSQNTDTVVDEAGDHDPWLEIANPLPVTVSLAGVTVRNLAGDSHEFAAETLAGDGHLLLWADGEPGEGSTHLPVLLAPAGGALVLAAPDGQDTDTVIYPALPVDTAYARVPDSTGDWQVTTLASPGLPNPVSLEPLLVINEFLASNEDGITDETGEAEDWLELHNPGDAPVYLAGMTLTDDLADPFQWPLPNVVIEPGGFLVVWCDDDPGDGPLHATFKLSAGGEEVGLFQGEELLDYVVFGPQTTDVSYGRETDAGLPWVFFDEPTPGVSNGSPIGVVDGPPPVLELPAPYPNPFNPQTTVAFSLPRAARVELLVFDLRGRRVRALWSGDLVAGRHERSWDGADDRGRSLPSGVYCVRLAVGGELRTRRVMLVR